MPFEGRGERGPFCRGAHEPDRVQTVFSAPRSRLIAGVNSPPAAGTRLLVAIGYATARVEPEPGTDPEPDPEPEPGNGARTGARHAREQIEGM